MQNIAGYFDGNYGLLSGTNKMQDNLYYQDFSYVIKTNTDVETYRDKILELVHPAGMAMFGEILMTANLSVTLFDNATRNIGSTQANTAQVANTVDVPLYIIMKLNFIHQTQLQLTIKFLLLKLTRFKRLLQEYWVDNLMQRWIPQGVVLILIYS